MNLSEDFQVNRGFYQKDKIFLWHKTCKSDTGFFSIVYGEPGEVHCWICKTVPPKEIVQKAKLLGATV